MMKTMTSPWKTMVGETGERLVTRLAQLPAYKKILLVAASDFVALAVAAVLAQFHYVGATGYSETGYTFAILAPSIGVLGMVLSRSYRLITRYPGASMALYLGRAMLIAVLLLVAVEMMARVHWHWWRAAISFGLFGFIFLLVIRLMIGSILRASRQSTPRSNVLIYGAGEAGVQLLAALDVSGRYKVVAFVDDNKGKQGRTLSGLRIYPPADLAKLRAAGSFDSVLLAIPSANRTRRREVLLALEALAVRVLEMPSVDELVRDGKRIDDLREVQVEDLLGREPIDPIESMMQNDVTGRRVLITGAGGSIGSELCRQILQWGARKLVMFEFSEFALYQLEQELRPLTKNGECELVPILGTTLNQTVLRMLLVRHGIDTVYHTAAYKHVPLVEQNIASAVANNVLGTWRTLQAAEASGVRNFVLISTDKAVRPTGVMGASKRVCEQIVQARASFSNMRMSIVRFGNVLDSSGSVVPLFRAQIKAGGPVTVTHRDITRYFMTIREAAQLVIQAGAMGQSGEVFVLDMGAPVRIYELAERMIHLAGLRVRDDNCPEGDIGIRVSGLRPGEKLYEELLIGNNPLPTAHPRIFLAKEECAPLDVIESVVDRIELAAESGGGDASVRADLSKLIEGFPYVAGGALRVTPEPRANVGTVYPGHLSPAFKVDVNAA